MQDLTRQLAIITRFGVRLGGRPLEPVSQFERRLELLTMTSARFVADFDACDLWVIETDEFWFDRLSKDVENRTIPHPPHGNTRIVRRGFAQDTVDLSPSATPTLTVRLDSDDYYLPAAMTRALALSSRLPDGWLLDFAHGYLLDVKQGRAQRKSYAMQGPFVGVTTTGFDPTLLMGNHTQLRRVAPVAVFQPAAWVQTVHGANYLTRMAADSTVMRARQIRRQWKRRVPGRPWHEVPRYLRQLLPVTERTRNRLLWGDPGTSP